MITKANVIQIIMFQWMVGEEQSFFISPDVDYTIWNIFFTLQLLPLTMATLNFIESDISEFCMFLINRTQPFTLPIAFIDFKKGSSINPRCVYVLIVAQEPNSSVKEYTAVAILYLSSQFWVYLCVWLGREDVCRW